MVQDLGTWFLLKITAVNSGHIKRKVDNENEAKVHYNKKSVQHLEIQFPQDKKHILASHKNGILTAIFHTVLKERYETLILKRER